MSRGVSKDGLDVMWHDVRDGDLGLDDTVCRYMYISVSHTSRRDPVKRDRQEAGYRTQWHPLGACVKIEESRSWHDHYLHVYFGSLIAGLSTGGLDTGCRKSRAKTGLISPQQGFRSLLPRDILGWTMGITLVLNARGFGLIHRHERTVPSKDRDRLLVWFLVK